MKHVVALLILAFACFTRHESVARAEPLWHSLPLITEGKVDAAWKQIGDGQFVVDGDALRGESDETGMGMLLYFKKSACSHSTNSSVASVADSIHP